MTLLISKVTIRTLITLVILQAPFAAELTLAEQAEFDARQEQSPRTHDFDVRHYRIELFLDEPTRSFEAETAVTFSSTVDGFDTLILDAETFTVSDVARKGRRLSFDQQDGVLTIELDRALNTGEETTINIEYSVSDINIDSTRYGMGAGYDLGFNFKAASPTNPAIIFTLSFPEGARHWFPSFDHPGDWATHETIVHVRGDYRVVSNGKLLSDTVDEETGRRRVHWSQVLPQPTYLYVMVAGNHSILEDNYGELPLHYWVYPGDEADARLSFGPTPRMLGFFEEAYGTEYPWVKYDQIVIPGIGGGAESTSATVISEWTVKSAAELEVETPDALIAHELAHQWWGNMVGYNDWEHMWLSESFATHAEYLYAAYDLSADEAAMALNYQKAAYLTEARTRFLRPIVTNKRNRPNEMFDRHTYEKGGVVLNMFREFVGYETFASIMQAFLETHAYENATTEDFTDIVREVTGKDYDWFFEQWIYRAGHPVLDISYDWNQARKLLTVTIKQLQTDQSEGMLFRLPVKIAITTSEGKTVENIIVDQQQANFDFEVGEKPLLVKFDEGDVLLKEWSFDKSVDELIFQLQHDGAPGRLWAVGELQQHLDSEKVRSALFAVSEDDPVRSIREKATAAIDESSSP